MPTKQSRKTSKRNSSISKLNPVEALLSGDMSPNTRKKTSQNFYERVYAIVDQIPLGRVTTYGAIAETLGMKGSSRMVGHALNAIPEGSGLPAHRVINRIGALSGAHHFGGFAKMKRMLTREGVTFKGELVNMERHFWHPREIGE